MKKNWACTKQQRAIPARLRSGRTIDIGGGGVRDFGIALCLLWASSLL